jgi:transposase-like protein
MAKKKMKKSISRATRAQILAIAKAKGWTAKQVAKKFGISAWTFYGWRKRTASGAKGARRGKKPGRPVGSSTSGSTVSTAALRDEIRAALPGILREELARAIRAMLGGGTGRRWK